VRFEFARKRQRHGSARHKGRDLKKHPKATKAQTDPTEYTHYFSYHSGRGPAGRTLDCDDVSVDRIADSVGTPTYVYSQRSIQDAYRRLDRAFGSLPHTLCYALKANPNLSILRLFAGLGSSFDIVSGGELDRLRRIGIPGNRIVFSGVGKTRDEIREAIRYSPKKSGHRGILLFNIESQAELEVLLSEASRQKRGGDDRVSAAIRVNPDILAGGHPHISTGYRDHKFGMEWPGARRLYVMHRDSRWIAWRGITTHIGSQIVSVAPFERAIRRIAGYVTELAAEGIHLDYVDIGGGLGIRYTTESPINLASYARALVKVVRPLGCKLLLEPGRALVGPAGVLLTRVLYTKVNRGKHFVIVDAAMNDLIRPSLYRAEHAVTKATRDASESASRQRVDVVGPVCESGDFLARDWPLPPVKSGDLLVIWAVGAYGIVQASNYNARRRPAEVLVNQGKFQIIRKRQTYDDLVRGEPLGRLAEAANFDIRPRAENG
jgi:diaminopimelate decarboxylase